MAQKPTPENITAINAIANAWTNYLMTFYVPTPPLINMSVDIPQPIVINGKTYTNSAQLKNIAKISASVSTEPFYKKSIENIFPFPTLAESTLFPKGVPSPAISSVINTIVVKDGVFGVQSDIVFLEVLRMTYSQTPNELFLKVFPTPQYTMTITVSKMEDLVAAIPIYNFINTIMGYSTVSTKQVVDNYLSGAIDPQPKDPKGESGEISLINSILIGILVIVILVFIIMIALLCFRHAFKGHERFISYSYY